MITSYHLDRGPRVIAVTPDSPGAAAGLMTDDIVLALDGRSLSIMANPTAPFDQASALAALDLIDARIATATATAAARLTVLRGGQEHDLSLGSVPGCPLRLHVAQSGQRNAFADGVHVLIPIGMIGWVQDDNQLALVIAHEMAHNLLGHAAALRSTPRGADRRALLRQQEDAADVLGARLTQAAGYDLLAASKVFILTKVGLELFPAHRDAKGRARLTLAQAGLREQDGPRP